MPRDTVADTVRMLRRAPDAKAFVRGAVSTYCVIDDEEMLADTETGRPVKQSRIVATIARGAVPLLAREDSVTVGGNSYQVYDIMRGENGDLLRVFLA